MLFHSRIQHVIKVLKISHPQPYRNCPGTGSRFSPCTTAILFIFTIFSSSITIYISIHSFFTEKYNILLTSYPSFRNILPDCPLSKENMTIPLSSKRWFPSIHRLKYIVFFCETFRTGVRRFIEEHDIFNRQ